MEHSYEQIIEEIAALREQHRQRLAAALTARAEIDEVIAAERAVLISVDEVLARISKEPKQ